MPDTTLWRSWLTCHWEVARQRRSDERGAIVPEWVIMLAIIAAGAIAIATLVIVKFTGKAATIPTD